MLQQNKKHIHKSCAWRVLCEFKLVRCGYRNDGEWQPAAEKSCHDIKYDGQNTKEYTIDTCAGIARDGIYTRKDLGHWDSWHFVTHPRTCEIVMRHELNKLKFMARAWPVPGRAGGRLVLCLSWYIFVYLGYIWMYSGIFLVYFWYIF